MLIRVPDTRPRLTCTVRILFVHQKFHGQYAHLVGHYDYASDRAPQAILEAVVAGCVVVVSSTPPVKEAIRDGENGLLVDFVDADAISEKVEAALAELLERGARTCKADHRREIRLRDRVPAAPDPDHRRVDGPHRSRDDARPGSSGASDPPDCDGSRSARPAAAGDERRGKRPACISQVTQ